jgi:hypothetical protein
MAGSVVLGLRRLPAGEEREWLLRAFVMNSGPRKSVFPKTPVGWNRRAQRELEQVLADADTMVQRLNDRFTNPSGEEQSLAEQVVGVTAGQAKGEGGAAA